MRRHLPNTRQAETCVARLQPQRNWSKRRSSYSPQVLKKSLDVLERGQQLLHKPFFILLLHEPWERGVKQGVTVLKDSEGAVTTL